jgi:hypothetical protein
MDLAAMDAKNEIGCREWNLIVCNSLKTKQS